MAAFDKKPSTWLPNWHVDGTDIHVPIATFPQLTDAEAQATTGDIRKVWFAMLEQLWAMWNTRTVTNSETAPTNMTVYRGSSTNEVTGVVTKQFTVIFKTTVTGEEVVDET